MARRTSNNQEELEEQDDLSGYPPYPAGEDIMRKGKRVEGSYGDDSPDAPQPVQQPETAPAAAPVVELPDGDTTPGRYDLTEEDLQALGPADLSLDLGDDEQLKQRTQPVDFAATDLDVPGAELDDKIESTGFEDEENNSYSLGGDAHSDLEEGRQ
jgi:hypothetical protein